MFQTTLNKFCQQVQLVQYFFFMLEISDDKIWEATKLLYNSFKQDDQRERLDPDNLKQFKKENIKPLYPHKATPLGIIQKYTCCESCCTVDPGNFCCCNTKQPDSSFRKLGLSICLYFKFMKHSTIAFIFITLLSVVSCLICYLVANLNGFDPTSNYQTFLFSTTLGTFSSQRIKCQYAKLPTVIGPVTFNLNCPYGRVNYFGATYSAQSYNTLNNCKNEIKNYNSGSSTYAVTGIQSTSCSSNGKSCSITVTPSSLPSNFSTIAYSYECLDQSYSFGLYSFKSQYLLYVVIGIDFLCCIIIGIFYCSEAKAQQKQIRNFKQSQLSLNDFSLKFSGFNMTTFDEQFNTIVRSLTRIIGEELLEQLVQIKVPDRDDFVQYDNKRNEAYRQLYEFIVEEFFDNQVNPEKYKSAENFIDSVFQTGKYEKYKEKLLKYISNFHFLEYNPDQDSANKKCSIFIVVNSIKMKKKIYEMQKDGCFKKYYEFNHKEYVLSEPPPPDLIIWKNKGKFTFIRLIISWIITLAICGGSYVLFGYIQYQQNQYLSTYNFNIDCNLLYSQSVLTTFSTSLNQADKNYLTCFCMNNLFSFDYSQCTDFRKTYVTYLAIPVIISFLLVIYNVFVSSFFKILSKLECHRLVTSQLFSYTIKRSFLLIMNMALIMIILNMNYTSSSGTAQFSFLLQGKYNDLTPDWYMNIGAIIILTMIFNITFPIIELILANILKCIRKCWDKKFCCRKTSCKTKQEYIQLYNNDIYPIQQRYAFLISIILITLAFSCVIPILNIIYTISIILLYFSDKVLIFKVYQTPVNYGPQLHKLVNKTVYFGLIAHFALSAFFLSEGSLLAPFSFIPGSERLNSYNSRINVMIKTFYIIPYVIMFLLYTGWLVFSNTLLAFCDKCSNMCKKNLSNITKYKLEQSLFDCISNYQLSKMKMMIEGEMSKITTKTNAYRSIKNNKSMFNDSIKGLTLELQTNQSAAVAPPQTEHEALLRRTLNRIKAEQSLRKKQKQFGDAYLMGMPCYEYMTNDDAFEQNKKNNALSHSLTILLKDVLQNMHD